MRLAEPTSTPQETVSSMIMKRVFQQPARGSGSLRCSFVDQITLARTITRQPLCEEKGLARFCNLPGARAASVDQFR